MISYDILLVLILAPAFVLVLQKYIEVRASYRRPTNDDISKVERRSGKRSASLLKNVPRGRAIALSAAILLSCTFGIRKFDILGWVSLGGLLICVIVLSILVNWRMIYKI